MFITFEGSEGSGKTTLVQALAEKLVSEGRDVLVTREPGEGPVGAAIREIVLHGEHLAPMVEAFLFLADRAQHVATVIRPALQAKKVVLCDRYGDSTIVYQGYGRGLDLSSLREWNRVATQGLSPDLTLLLDLDPRVGLARLKEKDRIDGEPIEFHERVRTGLLAEASREPKRWMVLDASRSSESILEEAWQALQARAADRPVTADR